MVAVKKLYTRNDFSDKLFLDEFTCLKRARHKNIVRLLGYCAYTPGEVMEVKGETMIVDEAQQQFLCLEYQPNGNLHHYLKEKAHGYEWNMHYQIIKGICQGLNYLHQEGIFHLDLKPANVLLGAQMEPKITDFGLSRCNDEKQSTISTIHVHGTLGYIAPELINNRQISCKSDIFSLGVIMIKVLTRSNEAPENWHELVDGDCGLLKKCIEIAHICCDHDRRNRPTIQQIILMLEETETMIQMIPPIIYTEPRDDPMSSLYQVVQRFRALPSPTPYEHSRMIGIYDDLNVLERILKGIQKPNNLPYQLLQFITENFSDERMIGHNEFGEFFKGILQVVAVIRLSGRVNIDDRMFHGEVKITMMAQHQNIVRFLGNCSYNTAKQEAQLHGKSTNAEIQERLLCFEYMSKGSLKKHLSDELRGLHWETRFQIIKGICEGLRYLHKEKHIIHMDLKPSNILLDDHMVPKITGLGISEFIVTSDKGLQWLEYSAPECMFDGVASRETDIYSLGVIIVELVTGSKEKPNIIGVLRKWKHRWNKSCSHTPLWYQQVIKCLELALSCLQTDPQRRPIICDIINELDNNGNVPTFDQINARLEEMLGIEPLELHFPYEHNKAITRSVQLINDTDDYFAFSITTSSSLPYRTEPSKNIVPPGDKFIVTITLPAMEKAPEQCKYGASQFYVQSTRVDDSLKAESITEDIFHEKPSKVVDKVALIVVLK